MPRGRGVSVGMASLDEVHLPSIFEYRAHVMRSIPRIMKGAYRSAMRVALQEAVQARTEGSELNLIRAWKMFLLLPRMLLHRPTRGGMVPKQKLVERLSMFQSGQWSQFVEISALASEAAKWSSMKRRRTEKPDITRWRRLLACSAAKAFALSLLEHRSPVSAGGEPPSVHDVIRNGLFER